VLEVKALELAALHHLEQTELAAAAGAAEAIALTLPPFVMAETVEMVLLSFVTQIQPHLQLLVEQTTQQQQLITIT
jgi:hypothetical protein